MHRRSVFATREFLRRSAVLRSRRRRFSTPVGLTVHTNQSMWIDRSFRRGLRRISTTATHSESWSLECRLGISQSIPRLPHRGGGVAGIELLVVEVLPVRVASFQSLPSDRLGVERYHPHPIPPYGLTSTYPGRHRRQALRALCWALTSESSSSLCPRTTPRRACRSTSRLRPAGRSRSDRSSPSGTRPRFASRSPIPGLACQPRRRWSG